MRAEEYDWIIYHVICEEKNNTADEICKKSGFSQEQVSESLERLMKTRLVECRGDRYRVCSLEEFIFSSQINQDPFSDIFIETGVIKVKTAAKQPEDKNQDDSGNQG